MKLGKLIFITLIIIILDQVTKQLALNYIPSGVVLTVIPGFFNLLVAFNKGVAFGLMSDFSDGIRTFIIFFSAVIAIVILIWLYISYYSKAFLHSFAIAFILGGALGNIIDRLVYGYVIDFLDFYIQNWHWPAFNIADSAICIGVVILILIKD